MGLVARCVGQRLTLGLRITGWCLEIAIAVAVAVGKGFRAS